MANDQLPTIDPVQLSSITGGASDADQQLQVMLQSLMSSIKDLAANNNSGNDQFMQMLPLLMIMRSRQQAAVAPPPPAPPAPPPGDGWIRVR